MDRRERMNDPTESTRMALEGRQSRIWTTLPGHIESYDPDKQTATVQPTIAGIVQIEGSARRDAAMPLLVDVPVQFPSGGGFTLTFPVTKGDECIIVFSARCIDAWWQAGGIQPQAEKRMHDLSDAMAIVGVRSLPRMLDPRPSAENVQLRSDDGEQHITITPSGAMTHRATTSITLQSPAINFEGLDGGNTTITLKGTLGASGDIKAGNISVQDHRHGGIQTGSGITDRSRV